jgi:hypothetical protein
MVRWVEEVGPHHVRIEHPLLRAWVGEKAITLTPVAFVLPATIQAEGAGCHPEIRDVTVGFKYVLCNPTKEALTWKFDYAYGSYLNCKIRVTSEGSMGDRLMFLSRDRTWGEDWKHPAGMSSLTLLPGETFTFPFTLTMSLPKEQYAVEVYLQSYEKVRELGVLYEIVPRMRSAAHLNLDPFFRSLYK